MSEMAEWEGRMGGERRVEGKPKWKGGVALSPGPFEKSEKKSEKRAWYPLFAHALNFLTFREFRIISCYLHVL